MTAWFRHPLLVSGRLLWLGFEFAYGGVTYLRACAFLPKGELPVARALWLQGTALRFRRIFGLAAQVVGPIPTAGLLVSNHLSYLDILVLAGCAPAVFVAKQEVKSWPFFGWFASMGGSIFVNRERRAQVGVYADEIGKFLDRGSLVVLFPEGTSSGGESVLPFKSSLLEPATRPGRAITVGLIQYEMEDGDVSEEVCYWKDMTFVPHLVNLLSKRGLRATLHLAQIQNASADRKELAKQLHAEVARLK